MNEQRDPLVVEVPNVMSRLRTAEACGQNAENLADTIRSEAAADDECGRCGAQHDPAEGCTPYGLRVRKVKQELADAKATIARLKDRLRADRVSQLEKSLAEHIADAEVSAEESEELRRELARTMLIGNEHAEEASKWKAEAGRLLEICENAKTMLEGAKR